MHLLALLFTFITVSVALPNQQDVNFRNSGPQNLKTTDPSLWFKFRNTITVPFNCKPGQEYINGVCRDVWTRFGSTTPLPRNFRNSDLEQSDRRRDIMSLPSQCPIGYAHDAFGLCREKIKYRTK